MKHSEQYPIFTYTFPVDGFEPEQSSFQNRERVLTRDTQDATSAVIVDTFDHKVLQAQMLLLQLDEQLLLLDFSTGRFCEQSWSGEWRFAEDLERGPVASVLAEISRLRAFLALGEVDFRFESGLLLDDEEKTLARFRQFVFWAGKKNFGYGVTQSLRGYTSEHEDLVALLKKSGAVKAPKISSLYKKLGLSSLQYTAKPALSLQEDAPAKESAVQIIAAFLKVARANEMGVIDDLDTEFLHDYRVSLRKVRSVLSLFKGVFDKEQTTFLKNEFAELMRPTNRLRDLDVYLLERSVYFAMVPESTHAGLTTLFAYFEEERRQALRTVRKTLKSSSYVKKMNKLEKLFRKKKNLTQGAKSVVPSQEFGCRLIYKRYLQVCRIASSIDEHTEDEQVHQLRISCKKLRYLMEFFAPLFPGEEIKVLIKSLKKLQDTLGSFNDYSVQQEFLRHIAQHNLEYFAEQAIAVSEAIGALTALLHRLQRKERQRVMSSFQRFDSEETRVVFQKLFSI